jgi:predicted RNase H-like nuclease (RuvC/YqgF family)
MEELEKIVAERIGKLKTAVKEGEAVVAIEAQHAEQVIESFRENIAALEAKLRETEETVRRKDSASQRMEESLTAKIHELQNDAKKKEQTLENRANEINDLKSKIDGQVKQVAQLESAIQKARAETANQAKRAEQLSETSRAKIAALEAQLKDTEEIARKKESAIKALEQNLAAKVQDFEGQVKKQAELLASRDAEVKDLNSQLKLLTRGIKEMSSFFKQAEALSTVEGQGGSPIVLSEPLNGGDEKPAAHQPKAPAVTSKATEPPREIVSPDLFQRMTGELTQVVGPMASMIVRDHVVALGESIEKFPKTRLTELVKVLSEEIGDEKLKVGFRERLAANQ